MSNSPARPSRTTACRWVLLGTGGTIAGQAQQQHDHLGYQAGSLGVRDLVASLPDGLAPRGWDLVAEDVAQIDSKDMDWPVWRALALRAAAHLADDRVGGLVITHGTDTLEETAWFLAQVLPARKPIVLTGAMRPASALVPDGPQNLLDALVLARSPGVQGVLAVVAGVVHGARWVRKVHPYRLDAFSSGDTGPLGWVEGGAVRWANGSAPARSIEHRPGLLERFAHADEACPWVEIVMSHAGASAAGVDALVARGVRGLVVATTGNGTVHQQLGAGLLRAQQAGVVVVRASRCAEGQLLPQPGDALPDAGGLSPVKARISLMLELMAR